MGEHNENRMGDPGVVECPCCGEPILILDLLQTEARLQEVEGELRATNNHLLAAEQWAEQQGIYNGASGVTLARHLERAWEKVEGD